MILSPVIKEQLETSRGLPVSINITWVSVITKIFYDPLIRFSTGPSIKSFCPVYSPFYEYLTNELLE